jgi:hypothetical protein|tara:strand:+ start:233 stop:715 length:483 start_codon:yes stop_codon:yes gene_type:complete
MEIESLNSIEPSDAKYVISKNRGIYFWFDRKTDSLVYIGIAVGVGGLRRRIVSQHLNPKYLEYRTIKHTEKDHFQLSNAVKRLSKDNKTVRKGIDKSAFRKSIGRMLKLKPGNETVEYIVNNLYVKTHESEDITAIKLLEEKLISEYQPKFNTTHKHKNA